MKKILVTQRLDAVREDPETREGLDVRWGRFFRSLGMLPLALPSCYGCAEFAEGAGIDGILLTGGNTPAVFDDNALSRERDSVETNLLSYAEGRGIPVMGYGIMPEPVAGHVGRHGLALARAGEGHAAAGFIAGRADVNSYHNFGIRGSCEGFDALATAPDGVIEAMAHRGLPVMGLMWHPERETDFSDADLGLFKWFFSGGCKQQ